MQRNCDSCSSPYTAQRPNSRFCSESCRKKAARGTDSPRIEPIAAGAVDSAAGTTRSRVQVELEEAGRAETYLGAAALALADRIDQSTAVMGFAALVKELRATMEAATAGVVKAGDAVDEVTARREEKLRRVAGA